MLIALEPGPPVVRQKKAIKISALWRGNEVQQVMNRAASRRRLSPAKMAIASYQLARNLGQPISVAAQHQTPLRNRVRLSDAASGTLPRLASRCHVSSPFC